MKLQSRKSGLAAYLRSHEHQGGIIVSEELKFIYMKTAKTAGSSILRATLEKELSGIIHHKDHPREFEEWRNRITDEELEDYFIFSVIRNPWDRLVSVSAYYKIPFHDFIQNIYDYWEEDKIRIHSLPLCLYTHIDGVPFVDFICRFECLQPDMNLVFDHLGLNRKQLPFTNRSKHNHYSSYYTESQINKVAEIYKDDIQYFGYTFEPEVRNKTGIYSRITHGLSRITSRFT